MISNDILTLLVAFVLGYFAYQMMRNMCGNRLIEGDTPSQSPLPDILIDHTFVDDINGPIAKKYKKLYDDDNHPLQRDKTAFYRFINKNTKPISNKEICGDVQKMTSDYYTYAYEDYLATLNSIKILRDDLEPMNQLALYNRAMGEGVSENDLEDCCNADGNCGTNSDCDTQRERLIDLIVKKVHPVPDSVPSENYATAGGACTLNYDDYQQGPLNDCQPVFRGGKCIAQTCANEKCITPEEGQISITPINDGRFINTVDVHQQYYGNPDNSGQYWRDIIEDNQEYCNASENVSDILERLCPSETCTYNSKTNKCTVKNEGNTCKSADGSQIYNEQDCTQNEKCTWEPPAGYFDNSENKYIQFDKYEMGRCVADETPCNQFKLKFNYFTADAKKNPIYKCSPACVNQSGEECADAFIAAACKGKVGIECATVI